MQPATGALKPGGVNRQQARKNRCGEAVCVKPEVLEHFEQYFIPCPLKTPNSVYPKVEL